MTTPLRGGVLPSLPVSLGGAGARWQPQRVKSRFRATRPGPPVTVVEDPAPYCLGGTPPRATQRSMMPSVARRAPSDMIGKMFASRHFSWMSDQS